MAVDYSEFAKNVADTISKTGHPLTEDQYLALVGSMSVYLDIAYKEGKADFIRDIYKHLNEVYQVAP